MIPDQPSLLSCLIASIEISMGQVLIRNLDDRVIENLKTNAELKGQSLEQELREVLTNAALLRKKPSDDAAARRYRCASSHSARPQR